MFSPENREEQRHKDNAGSSDKSGFCGRGVEEARGLERVAAEHEEAERSAGEEFFPVYGAEGFGAECGHESGGQREAEREKDENAGVGKGIFYDDESGAPEKSADDEGEVGFEGGGLGGGGRGSDGGLRMGVD